MRNNMFFQITVSLFIICSAFFAKYVADNQAYEEEAVGVMAQGRKIPDKNSITFTDLAQTLEVFASGEYDN